MNQETDKNIDLVSLGVFIQEKKKKIMEIDQTTIMEKRKSKYTKLKMSQRDGEKKNNTLKIIFEIIIL